MKRVRRIVKQQQSVWAHDIVVGVCGEKHGHASVGVSLIARDQSIIAHLHLTRIETALLYMRVGECLMALQPCKSDGTEIGRC